MSTLLYDLFLNIYHRKELQYCYLYPHPVNLVTFNGGYSAEIIVRNKDEERNFLPT